MGELRMAFPRVRCARARLTLVKRRMQRLELAKRCDERFELARTDPLGDYLLCARPVRFRGLQRVLALGRDCNFAGPCVASLDDLDQALLDERVEVARQGSAV